MSGIPVVISTNGFGIPVKQVTDNAPVMTVSTNGYGTPIVLSDFGTPFIVEGGGGPTPTLRPVHSPIIFIGDGIGATGSAPGRANFPTRVIEGMNGRVRGTAGWNLHDSGDSMLLQLTRSKFAWRQVAGYEDAIIVIGPTGHNDDVNSIGLSAWLARWDACVDEIIDNSVCDIIIGQYFPSTSIANESNYRADIWAHQLARDGTAGGRVRVAPRDTSIDPTAGVDTPDGTHPSETGAKKIADPIIALLDTMVEAATVDDILNETSANVAMGLGAIMHINRALSGSGGSKTGTIPATGNVANSHTLLNNLTNGTGVAVVADNTTEAGTQAYDVAGTPASANTTRLSSANTAITGSTPGRLVEWVGRIRMDNGAGGAPVGVRGFSADMVNFGTLGGSGAITNQLADMTEVYDHVVRVPPLPPFGGAGPYNYQGQLTVRHSAVAQDTRIRLDRPGFRYVDLLERSAPVYLGNDGVQGANYWVRLETATGVVTATPALDANGTGTITAATVSTVRLATGVFEGGNLTFTRQILLNGVEWVGHQVTIGGTDNWSGLLTAGDQVTVIVTATNGKGSASATCVYTVA